MKGLALEVIVGLIIAIAGILLFFSLLGYFKEASNWFYCNVYIKIRSFFAEGAIPSICKYYTKESVEIVEIGEKDKKPFARKLLAYIIACWKEAEIKGLYKTHPCYELHLLNQVDDVNEETVNEILIKEDRCTSIENSDYGCGTKDQIIWDVDGNVSISLTTKNISDAINRVIIPTLPTPINENMFSLDSIIRKIQLKHKLSSSIPEKICENYPNCFNWWDDRLTDKVTLNISATNYTYSIDLVLSYLEKNGLINSTINNQKIILIRYDGHKDAVEVIG